MTTLTCWSEGCTEPPTSVVIVPSYEDGPHTPYIPKHYVDATCDGHAPELMHELLNSGFPGEDITTATIDRKEHEDAQA